MPPYRAGGAASRGGSAYGVEGVLSRGVTQRDNQMQEALDEIGTGVHDLATKLGLEDDSPLDKQAHKRLAEKVQKLAAAGATLELKRKATTSALKKFAEQMDNRAARGSAAAPAPGELPPEQMNMSYFLEEMKGEVSSAMEGADEKALESKKFKEVMKKISATDGGGDDDVDVVENTGHKVSLKCPCTSTTVVDPVKSKKCGHTYGKQAILHHIRVGSKKGSGASAGASCPVAACSHKVAAADLVEDKEMKRRLRIESNTQRTQPEVDAEDIDDDAPMGETSI